MSLAELLARTDKHRTGTLATELVDLPVLELLHIPLRLLLDALKNGKLEEAWGCGTAAVVSPIGQLSYAGENYIINNFEIGKTTQALYDTLTAIQWGRSEDPYGWTVKI